MEFTTIDEVRADLQRQKELREIVSKAPKLNIGAPDPNAGKIQDISYSGGFGNVYEKGSSGNYQMRYENYLGATGNENRLGLEQSGWEQAFNGIVKNISKAGIYAFDATVGTLYGIGSAIQDRKISSLWDNDLSNSLDYASKYLDRELPNYYTDEQKSRGILGKMASVNFWTNDFANGMAFVAGAVLPSILTGGTSLVASSARAGAKVTLNVARKEGKTALRQAIRGAYLGNKAGEILNFGKFVAQSAVFESGMEARNNFHDSIETWINQYVQENGVMPTTEETDKYVKSAESASNVLFGGNLALLSITNAAMFGKAFGLGNIKLPGTNSFNKLIGVGVESGEKGMLKTLTPSKFQKILGKSYFIGRKPFSEGVVEEGLQGVMGKMAEDYTQSKYEGDTPYDFTKSLADAFKQQYGTREGWNEIGVGMLVGMLGNNVQGSIGIEGVGGLGKRGKESIETYSKRIGEINGLVEQRNKYVDTFRNLNRSNSMFNASRNKKENLQDTELFQDVVSNYSYIKANMPLKGMRDMVEDYNAVIDGLEITDDQLIESGLEDVNEYKSLMKSQFQSDFEIYKKVNSFVNNLDIKPTKLSGGNSIELTDALTLSLMMGEKADEQSQRLASNIESLTGVSGAYSALKFFETLNEKQLVNVNKLKKQQENLTKLENKLVKIQNSISENKATGENKEKVTQLSKKYAVVSGQINTLNESIDSIKDTLNNEFDSIKSSDLTINTDYSNVSDVLDTVDNIRGLVQGLRKVGRTQDAKRLENYLEQFSVFTQTALDSKSVQDSLLNSNFFKSDKGKKLLSSIVGDKYKASNEASEAIKGIEEDIINKASGFGYSVANTEEFLNLLESNENLSDREKYRIEGIARTLATQKAISDRAEEVQKRFDREIQDEILEEDIQNIDVESPNIVGDTIRTSSTLRNLNPTNSEQLKALVDEIASLNDQITNKPTSTQLAELKKKRKQLESLNAELELAKSNINNLNLESFADKIIPTTQISVGNQPETSREVREGDTKREEIAQESQEEEIANEIFNSLDLTDKDFVTQMLKDAIEYESNSEFGNPELANEYTEVLNRLENGEIDVNEIGSVFNRPTTGEDIRSTGTGTEGVSTKNGDIVQVSQTNEDLIRQEEERINSIEKEIDSISREIIDLERPFKFLETAEYKEFNQLLNIPEDQRTTEQQIRLDELRTDINDWIMIMGTETQGVNFADIVEQMVALDNVETYDIPDTIEMSPDEVEENFTTFNLANRQNLRVGLNFNAVTSTIKKDGDGVTYTEIANMSLQGLEDASGVLLEGEDGVTMNPVTNAIQLSDVMVNRINSNGKVFINTFDEGLSTFYTPVRQATVSLSGDTTYTILRTDFYDQYAPEEIDDETIYNLKSGEEVFIAVDPFDPYNQNLLNEVSRELGVMSEQEVEAFIEDELKVYKTQQLTKAQKKLRDLQTARKRDRNKIAKQEELIQELLDAQRERLRKKISGKRKTKLSETLNNELRSKLKLMIVNKDGENLNVLKGSRDVKDIEKLDAVKLQAIRDTFANNIEFLTKMIEAPSLDIVPVGIKVDKVLPGFPNYYATVNNGVLSRQSKVITSVDINKIHDVGYLEKGKILTRFGIENIDTTFLSKQISNKVEGKIPIVVIKKGNQNIAYPISIVAETPPVTADEMRSIKNSSLPEVEKAIKLNELLAKAGVNTQQEGNAFLIVSGEPINSEFFEDKVAQVESITYLRSVEDFLDERVSKEELLVGNTSININLSEPFISPKLRLDFSNVEVKEVSNENLREKSKKTVSGVMSQLALDRQKICK